MRPYLPILVLLAGCQVPPPSSDVGSSVELEAALARIDLLEASLIAQKESLRVLVEDALVHQVEFNDLSDAVDVLDIYVADLALEVDGPLLVALASRVFALEVDPATGTAVALVEDAVAGQVVRVQALEDDHVGGAALVSFATTDWVSSQDYATQSDVVQAAIGGVDLSGFATESWVTSQAYLQAGDTADHVRQTWLVEQNFATQGWIGEQQYLDLAATTSFATEDWVSDQGYLGSDALGGYATQSWTSDQGYLGSDALSGYATQSWTLDQGYLGSDALGGYATQSWTSDQGYLGSDALTGYATQSWVSGQGYLSSDALTGYATQSWVSGQGYLGSEALTGYATQSWVGGQIAPGTSYDIDMAVTIQVPSDYPTLDEAFGSLSGQSIAPTAWVTIELAAGLHTVGSFGELILDLAHYDGADIYIEGVGGSGVVTVEGGFSVPDGYTFGGINGLTLLAPVSGDVDSGVSVRGASLTRLGPDVTLEGFPFPVSVESSEDGLEPGWMNASGVVVGPRENGDDSPLIGFSAFGGSTLIATGSVVTDVVYAGFWAEHRSHIYADDASVSMAVLNERDSGVPWAKYGAIVSQYGGIIHAEWSVLTGDVPVWTQQFDGNGDPELDGNFDEVWEWEEGAWFDARDLSGLFTDHAAVYSGVDSAYIWVGYSHIALDQASWALTTLPWEGPGDEPTPADRGIE